MKGREENVRGGRKEEGKGRDRERGEKKEGEGKEASLQVFLGA